MNTPHGPILCSHQWKLSARTCPHMSKAAHTGVHVSQTSAEKCLFRENLHVVTSHSWYNFVETCCIGWTNGKLCSKLTNLNAIWIDIVDIGLLTINSCRESSVNFFGHYCICYCLYRSRGIDMRKIVRSFTSDTALNDVLVHALVCRIRKNKKTRFKYTNVFLFHTHTHTHYTNVTTTTTLAMSKSGWRRMMHDFL